jgi:hypothetical protein
VPIIAVPILLVGLGDLDQLWLKSKDRKKDKEDEARSVVVDLTAFVSDVATIRRGVSAAVVGKRLADAQHTWREMRGRVETVSLDASSPRIRSLTETMIVTLNHLLRDPEQWAQQEMVDKRIFELWIALKTGTTHPQRRLWRTMT